ncbi:hypothetical protein EUGRSUZ_C03945 [Eucalyptus grandis]|uniref:Uncharacterized protein n=2 Tax=Eucalyptus grandis TaxID=71139 RepID=A0ACC3LL08_EUCGR|nr:hypothetical protein EUGRSUZ_C03945 [Eucalyptus grandis]
MAANLSFPLDYYPCHSQMFPTFSSIAIMVCIIRDRLKENYIILYKNTQKYWIPRYICFMLTSEVNTARKEPRLFYELPSLSLINVHL